MQLQVLRSKSTKYAVIRDMKMITPLPQKKYLNNKAPTILRQKQITLTYIQFSHSSVKM